MTSLVCRDMHKSGGYQRARRTAAMASLKVGSRLSYHAAVRGRTAPTGERTIRFAQTVTKENNPSSAGVVRSSNRLTRPVGQCLVPPTVLAAPTLRRSENRQEWQRPAPADPGDRHHDHERQPAQTTRLDEMAVGGAHRIAVDAARLDLGPPASLDRVVDADHHLARGQEGVEHLGKELVRDGASVPARPAQHLVVACETRFRRQPHDPQRLAYRALAWRQHRSGNKHEDVVPNRRCEAVTEGGQPGSENLWRQVRLGGCRPGTG